MDSIEIAVSYYEKSKQLAEKSKDKWLIFNVCVSMANVFLFKNDYKKAEECLSKMNLLANELKIKSAFYQLNYALYTYYRQTRHFDKALTYFEIAKAYNDSISNEEIQKRIVELDKKYDLVRKDKELIMNQERIKRQQIIIWFAGIGSLLIVLFLMVVIWQYRQKRAAYQVLEKQKEEIHDQAEHLKQLNATKDKFFSIIAHDLRNPFNSLISMSNLLLLSGPGLSPEKLKKFAQSMNTSAKQAYSLLENLLEWSRIQTGKLIPAQKKEKPSELIGEVTTLLEPAAHSKNIALLTDIQDDDEILADREMTKTVIRNLITNALKFTNPEGQINIGCRKNSNEMVFSIADTGIGIEPECLTKLFRIDGNISKKGTANEEGTGLGLILCKEFVEKQHGSIRVESEPGKGSTFSFTLPLFGLDHRDL